ncbi:MAG TPA: RecQ family ATP-dependent DNA helicase, partial [Polyangiaceae bacterium LLY-WYZ-15_(1-7)]|nr:RecQ family ATP-dependent DNA helicase [Polyangiaceae bacterium LLY-WYZ-15_(1-7)]
MSLEDTLRERFGFDAFRPWQREAIEALLEGPRRVLVVAPTGGGKSLTYQLPAVVLEGTTIVISPLIALMEDQVRGLEEKGVRATYLTSSISMDERRRRERALRDGEYDLVYVAPEGMANDYTMALLEGLQPQLVAIDEAHCISQWGHDFRPDYLRLGPAIRRLAPRHVLACTATATPIVREDILANLGFDDARVVLRGFARPNLHLEAIPLDSRRHRDRQL